MDVLQQSDAASGGVGPVASGASGYPTVTSAQLLSHTEVSDPLDMQGHWLVAQVRGGRERTLADLLAGMSIPHYVPLTQCRKRDAAGKSRVVTEPTFPWYVFACVTDDRQRDDLKGAYVGHNAPVHLIDVRDSSQRRLAEELHWFWKTEQEGMVLYPSAAICVGKVYEIVRGGLKGMRGSVIEIESSHFIQLEIEFIGGKRLAKVAPEDIDPID